MEPGTVVKQGKEHARSYPYRSSAEQYPMRTCQSSKTAMSSATDRKMVKGFRGISGLVALDGFDLIKGIVPYSPTHSGNPYFEFQVNAKTF